MRNYWTSIPADKSMALIERRLVKAGATHISKTYSGEKVDGFYFELIVEGKPVHFKLPVSIIAAQRVMELEGRRYKSYRSGQIADQAERVAWKILCDWVDVQLTMIEMEQALAIQIFLPYAYDGKKTLFERLQTEGFKQLEAPHE